MARLWKPEHNAVVYRLWPTPTRIEDILALLPPWITPYALRGHARYLGVRRPEGWGAALLRSVARKSAKYRAHSYWTPEFDEIVREAWPTDESSRSIRDRLVAAGARRTLTIQRVQRRAADLGVKRPGDWRSLVTLRQGEANREARV